MTMSPNPAATRRSICQTMSGLPPTSSKGLGRASESGRIRSPRPAARIMLRAISRAAASERVPDRGRTRLELVEQSQQSSEFAIARAGSAQVTHHARHARQISVLAIAVEQARENAQHFELSLHAHPFE